MKSILSLLFCNFLFFCSSGLTAHYLPNDECKMYVNSDDLLISEEGIFLKDHDEFIALSSISSDESGLYAIFKVHKILSSRLCEKGHLYYFQKNDNRSCNGCSNGGCDYRCTNSNCYCHHYWNW